MHPFFFLHLSSEILRFQHPLNIIGKALREIPYYRSVGHPISVTIPPEKNEGICTYCNLHLTLAPEFTLASSRWHL